MPSRQPARSTKKTARHQPLHKHAIASLLSTSHHTHSGKRLHSKHTSHGFLLVALLLTGVLLFSNLGALKAYGLSQGGSLNVSVNVLGYPPTEGAVIVFPSTNSQTSSPLIEVSGTCPAETLVSLYNNGTFAGSTICETDGVFSVIITLTSGDNILQAQNYDGLNQPGPVTDQHLVKYVPVINPTPTEKPVVTKDQPLPTLPNPVTPQPTAPQPSTNPCYQAPSISEAIKASKTPIISIGCIHRNIFAGEELTIAYAVNGGKSPYALNILWGDDSDDLKSISSNEIQTVKHTFNTAGTHTIIFKTTDSAGNTYQIQTVVIVNGDPAVATGSNTFIRDIQAIWLEAPIPLYFLAVALTLGFWIGDVFERITISRSARKIRRRHA